MEVLANALYELFVYVIPNGVSPALTKASIFPVQLLRENLTRTTTTPHYRVILESNEFPLFDQHFQFSNTLHALYNSDTGIVGSTYPPMSGKLDQNISTF